MLGKTKRNTDKDKKGKTTAAKPYRSRFTEEEDKLLKELVNNKKNKTWKEIAAFLPGRSACQCRDRYNQYLFKEIVCKPWTPEEDQIIVEKYKQYGPHWVKISQSLPGRSGNNVKNRWNSALTRYHGMHYQEVKQERRSKKVKWDKESEEKVTEVHSVKDSCSHLIDRMTDFMMKKVNEQTDIFGCLEE